MSSNNFPKIFIAGHNGMVGSALLRFLKNQEVNSIIENTTQDDENSFTKEAMEDTTEEEKSDNDLKEFGVDNDAPDLFSSENETSNSEELLSSENEDQEDDLEIPAFLRRQKN